MSNIPEPVMQEIKIGILQMLSDPACLVEIQLNVWFPEIKMEFNTWLRLQLNPNPADVYDWVQKKFPSAPVRDPNGRPDEFFRELAKHILASAMHLDYRTQSKLIVEGQA